MLDWGPRSTAWKGAIFVGGFWHAEDYCEPDRTGEPIKMPFRGADSWAQGTMY